MPTNGFTRSNGIRPSGSSNGCATSMSFDPEKSQKARLEVVSAADSEDGEPSQVKVKFNAQVWRAKN